MGEKAEDELTQLLDTFCGGGLRVDHVDVALKREYPALNQTPAPTELPTQAPFEAPTAVTTDVPTALPTSLPTVSALACPLRSPRTRPRRSPRAFRCTCRRTPLPTRGFKVRGPCVRGRIGLPLLGNGNGDLVRVCVGRNGGRCGEPAGVTGWTKPA